MASHSNIQSTVGTYVRYQQKMTGKFNTFGDVNLAEWTFVDLLTTCCIDC